MPIGQAWKHFDAEGKITSDNLQAQLEGLGQEVVRAAVQFSGDGRCDYSETEMSSPRHDVVDVVDIGSKLSFPASDPPHGERMVQLEKIEYKGWQNAYRVSNGIIEMVIPGDIGIRVIRFGFVGDENEFFESEGDSGNTGGDEWRFYGGHRLWHAPEQMPRTYEPDNSPVTVEQDGRVVRVTQPIEPNTRLQKQIEIEMAEDAPEVRVTHRITNHGLWAVEFAPWALSVMQIGGTAIIPLPPRGPHPENLVPSSTLTLWAYTDLSDPRWTFGQKYILRGDPNATTLQKIGASVPDGWIAYANNGHLFVKQFEFFPDTEYPDMNSSVETFTNNFFLEMETLAPTMNVLPNSTAEHIETWALYRDVAVPQNDADVDANVLPKVGG